jgi:hypothetical protein
MSSKPVDRTAVWATVALAGMTLASIVVLAALGRPLDGITQIIVLLIPNIITMLMTLVRVESVKRDVNQVLAGQSADADKPKE